MKDKHAGRRSFLRKLFGTTAAVVVAGPVVLEALDRIGHEPKTYVDMGRRPMIDPELEALLRQIRSLNLPPQTWDQAADMGPAMLSAWRWVSASSIL